MNYIFLIGLFVGVFSISFAGYHLLLQNKIFSFLKKKNTTSERWASQSKPILGGILFYIAFLFSILLSLLIFPTAELPTTYIITIVVCVSISFFMGLFDDLNNQGPFYKFLFQLICAIILIVMNMHITTSDSNIVNYALTIIWVIGIMNSINMLDNMDAITGSVALIILLGILGIAFTFGFSLDIIILLSIIASMFAYLYWNWNPSKIYMGDNGSQFLGIVLAIFSIKYVWNSTDSYLGFNYREFILIGFTFMMPIIDTTTVFINRISKGKSPFVGDTNHTTHNLVYLGLNERQVAIIFILLSLISNFLVYYIITQKNIFIHQIYYFVLLFILAIVFITFFTMSRIILRKKK